MNLFNLSLFLLLVLSLSGSSCNGQPSEKANSREVQNLTAFSKIYGYVKYFHPSDEAREIDWDKLAVLGAKKVKKAQNENELKEALEDLFLPIAPTIKFAKTEPDSNAFLSAYLERIGRDTTGLKTVAWQHLGVDLDDKLDGYISGRMNREESFSDRGIFFLQSIDHTDIPGNRLKLEAAVKADLQGENGNAELYIRASDENNRRNSSEHAVDVPPNADEWQRAEVVGRLDPQANQIGVGLIFTGVGRLWVDDVRLKTQNGEGDWGPVPVKNAGFEKEFSGNPSGWTTYGQEGIEVKITKETAFEGSKSLSISSPPRSFDRHPHVGETVVTKFVNGLWGEVPLALYSDEAHTLPQSSKTDFERLKKSLESINLTSASSNNENIWLAAIIIAWNELQHFYPYFDLIDTDWNKQLKVALKGALRDDTQKDFYGTLSRMLASTRDGHIRLYHPSINKFNTAGLPFLVDWIENNVVVTHSLYEQVQPGDIVTSVDGKDAINIIQDQRKHISGSPQLTLFRSLRQFGAGASGTEAVVEIKRGRENTMYTIPRSSRHSNSKIDKNHLPVTGQIEDGIYYVDLDRASMSRINDEMAQIAKSPGVIFDLRGYPKGNQQIISHLLTKQDTLGQMFQTPRIMYPDRKTAIGYRKSGPHLTPAEPHIQGDVVFITDARAISAAETVMSFIEHYDLGKIVGQPTAGTNGSINMMVLPGGIAFGWTGTKVLKHDGSQHHLIGIQPTVPVEKTIRGAHEGKDELLEKAIEVLK